MYNILGVVTGILGVVGFLPAIIYKIIKNQLPSTQLCIFDKAWEETDVFLRSLAEEGLFSGSRYLEIRTTNLRKCVLPYPAVALSD